jgi:cell wall-associated NlpC family hydrolase
MISQPDTGIRRLALVAIVATGIGACASRPELPSEPVQATRTTVPESPSGNVKSTTVGQRAASVALDQVGVPYRYGGSSPAGFDCSGLVYYSYARAGKAVPRTTSGLWNALAPVQTGRLRAGDLLFFKVYGKMSHVGIYVGNGRFVHAPSSGKYVSVERLGSEYYSRAFIRAARPQ